MAARVAETQPTDRAWRRALALRVLAAIGAAAVALFGIRCAGGDDFLAFYDVGARALQHGDIYAPSAKNGMYVFYAPHFALLMMPFAVLPPIVAGYVWFALKAWGLAWIVREASGEIRRATRGGPLPRGWPAHLALPFLLAANPILGELKLGQVNLFVFLFSLLAFEAARSGRPWRAAALFSVALVKVTPWVFVPWFIFRRQWKLLGALAAVGVGWVALLAAWFGPTRIGETLRSWETVSRTQKLGLASVAYFENQSLQGVSARLATVHPALLDPLLGVPLYRVLWVPAAALLFAVLAALAWRDRFRQALPRTEFAFVCLVMYLCSPDSRWAHQMQLIAPFTALAVLAVRTNLLARDGGEPAPALCGHWRTAVAAVIGMGLLFQVVLTRDVVGKRLDNLSRWAGTHFLFVVSATALLAAVSLRRHPSRVGADGAK
ncbi:glycosyltransferase family 87 protein [Anaeromyxobacter oryzisoli]|uniref:glycosyltransferase family 87 protein n=1 Tax=Anaeromyxobacter oryzisoli TaxID=2925408 RepID=UPI001F5834AE|nr:glycosyltransferase family 87 protein [Anaeromyxobacter sp. SG63]